MTPKQWQGNDMKWPQNHPEAFGALRQSILYTHHGSSHIGSRTSAVVSMFACDILLIDAVCFDLSSGHRTATCPVHLQCQETRLSDKVHKISQGSNSSASHISPKSRFDDTLSWMTFNGLHRWQHRDGSRTSRTSRIQTHGELRICCYPTLFSEKDMAQGRQCRNRLRWNVGRVVACVENEAGLWIEIVQMILKCT